MSSTLFFTAWGFLRPPFLTQKHLQHDRSFRYLNISIDLKYNPFSPFSTKKQLFLKLFARLSAHQRKRSRSTLGTLWFESLEKTQEAQNNIHLVDLEK